jgi:hypothetical protein
LLTAGFGLTAVVPVDALPPEEEAAGPVARRQVAAEVAGLRAARPRGAAVVQAVARQPEAAVAEGQDVPRPAAAVAPEDAQQPEAAAVPAAWQRAGRALRQAASRAWAVLPSAQEPVRAG